jgi:dihydrofolate synthase/folylpolyglutamate synthase
MNLRQRRDYLGRLEHFGIKLGLDNINTLLDSLGRPERRFPSVHIAGTNGKGSVSAMLESILRAAGFRTGLYTSPHLVREEERIRVNGTCCPPQRFAAYLDLVKETIDGLMAAGRLVSHPTFFEVLTALAFLQFAEEKVDVAVLEVGLGGRLDATNVVTPLVSVITTISRDHVKHLGSTVRSIAFEKAGIIKLGVPVVCGVRSGLALKEIRRRAAERHAPFRRAFGPGTSLEAHLAAGRFRFRYASGEETYDYVPGLAGRYQGENAAVAIAGAEVLDRTWQPIGKPAILRGVRDVRWEGRLETVSTHPLVVLDGAHNEEGVRSLAAHIRDVIRRPVILVFAAMKDKDIRTMSRILFPAARTIILTQAPYKRSAPPAAVLAAAPSFAARARLEPDVAKAVPLALAESAGRVPVVIAGSLFLVGEVKRLRLF